MVACKHCGKQNQPHYKFCLYCGSALPGSAGNEDMAKEKAEPEKRSVSGDPLPIEVDTGETPLPMPAPLPARFSIEAPVVAGDGGGPSGPTKTNAPAAPTPPTGAAVLGPGRPRQAEPTLRPEQPSRACKTCGALVPLGFQFCGSCGGRMDEERPATSAAPSGRLVLVRPDGSEGGSHPLREGVNLVGRGSGPLFDADSYLSPLHLQIELAPGGNFTLRDAGSLNGVFIKLTEEEPISDGAVFRIGQELLRFDAIRMPRPLEDGTEIMGSPNPGYWGRIAIIIGRAQDGSCFPLFGDAVVLGRERGDILFSEDGYVSGTHARISFRQGQVYLQDLASSNGTFLKVRGERSVRSGTFVLMGQQLFRVMLA